MVMYCIKHTLWLLITSFLALYLQKLANTMTPKLIPGSYPFKIWVEHHFIHCCYTGSNPHHQPCPKYRKASSKCPCNPITASPASSLENAMRKSLWINSWDKTEFDGFYAVRAPGSETLSWARGFHGKRSALRQLKRKGSENPPEVEGVKMLVQEKKGAIFWWEGARVSQTAGMHMPYANQGPWRAWRKEGGIDMRNAMTRQQGNASRWEISLSRET